MTDPWTLTLIFLGLVVVGVVVYLVVSSRKPKEDPFLHFRCPGCKRRLRYRERQVGHHGTCSHCGQSLTFPPASQSIE